MGKQEILESLRTQIDNKIIDYFGQINELDLFEYNTHSYIDSEGYFTKYVLDIYHPRVYFNGNDDIDDEQIRH